MNNIFGVDIDAQAVEVTKLSLLLKVLEGEARELQGKQLEFHRVLPDLGNNIKCGNSLIAPDFYAQPDLPALDDEARYKINAFDWAEEFKPVFAQGGFDAVIGNPPYVRIQGFPGDQIAYFSTHYKSAVGNYDLYVNFVEKGFKLLRRDGCLGFILPNKFIKTDYGAGLRGLIGAEKCLDELVDFAAHQVFKATTYTCLLFLKKRSGARFRFATSEASGEALARLIFSDQSSDALRQEIWNFCGESTELLMSKMRRLGHRLLDLPAEMSRGSSTGDDTVFLVDRATAARLEPEILRVPVFARNFSRYRFSPTDEWQIIFPYDLSETRARAFTEEELRSRFPSAYDHLKSRKFTLDRRKQFREWHAYSAPRNLHLHAQAQIAVPLLANRGLFALIDAKHRPRICPMAGGGYTLLLGAEYVWKPEFVLGLLNSKLLFWFLTNLSNIFRGGWITCTKQYFGELPIRALDPKSKTDHARHDQLVALVERMLKLHADLPAAKSPDAQTRLQREIKATDTAIDRLVYELYELTPEEIALVEAATAPPVKPAAVAETEPGANAQSEADAGHRYTVDEETKPYA